MAFIRRQITQRNAEIKEQQRQEELKSDKIDPRRSEKIGLYEHHCGECFKYGHCWKCCHKNKNRKKPKEACKHCKKFGHLPECCNKLAQILKNKRKNKTQDKYQSYKDSQYGTNPSQRAEVGRCSDESDDEPYGFSPELEFYRNKQQNQQNAENMNEQMRQQRSQALNKFNKEVAKELKDDVKLFTEELDDEKEVNQDMAQILLASVQTVMKSDPEQYSKMSLISITCSNDDRVNVENVLKQTYGVGSTYYDLQLEKLKVYGMWFVKQSCIPQLREQKNLYGKLDFSIVLMSMPQGGMPEKVMATLMKQWTTEQMKAEVKFFVNY